MMKEILKGHVSSDTAYIVNDYPYGFRLRCYIRYWLDVSLTKGARLVSQTSNPKNNNLTWNKPKMSTYSRFGGCMFLDEFNRVQWTGVNEYFSLQELIDWKKSFYEGLPENFKPVFDKWLEAKHQYNVLKEQGKIVSVTKFHQPDDTISERKEVLQPEIIHA